MFLQQLQRNAEFFPEDCAIVYGDLEITNQELLDQVERVAGGLRAHGIREGDRVGLILENCPEFVVSFYAVAACGAVNVPLSIEFASDEIGYFLEDAAAKCVIVDGARFQAASQAVADRNLDIPIFSTGENEAASSYSELAESAHIDSDTYGSMDGHVIYIYSSGSTGRPKCAPRTVIQYWWEMQEVIQGLRLSREDVIFGIIPFFHNFGAVHCMLAGPGSGAKVVMFRNPNPFGLRRRAVLETLEQEKVTIFPGVPFMFEHLAATRKKVDLSSIRICYSASAALKRETAVAFRARHGVQIRDHYGCTEVGAMTINLDSDPSQYADSVGHPFPGVHIRILDNDGKPLPPRKTGEVVVGSRAMTSGYIGLADLNAKAFRDGYFHTGDLGSLDEEGRLYLLGRKKSIIDVVGHKVDPFEVEDALCEHDAIDGAVAIGVPDETGSGQVVSAYVIVNRPVSKSELIEFADEKLANFKVPQSLNFVSEFPKNNMGKQLRSREALDRKVLSEDQLFAAEVAS